MLLVSSCDVILNFALFSDTYEHLVLPDISGDLVAGSATGGLHYRIAPFSGRLESGEVILSFVILSFEEKLAGHNETGLSLDILL